uniref:Uncharacterized protein n=1 Tax=Rhizophora mucronata TaxID=61149 RepID=A0A2P2PCW5_RHIMU
MSFSASALHCTSNPSKSSFPDSEFCIRISCSFF